MHEETITGLKQANIVDTSERSVYPPESDRVLVAPEHDGYRTVFVLDGGGNIVAVSERSSERVESALVGTGDGYDIVVGE